MHRPYTRKFISAMCFIFTSCSIAAAQENATLLRYGFAAGKQYAYEVTIQIEAEEYDEIAKAF